MMALSPDPSGGGQQSLAARARISVIGLAVLSGKPRRVGVAAYVAGAAGRP
jgi:hypothetical protein